MSSRKTSIETPLRCFSSINLFASIPGLYIVTDDDDDDEDDNIYL